MMERKVLFTNQQSCAHAWAHQQCTEGYATNFYFQGATIYSYGRHFPLATLCGNKVFFTDRGYSRSTSKHKYYVRAAITHKDLVFVEYVPKDVAILTDASFIDENLAYWTQKIKHLLHTYKSHPARRSILNEINHYVERIDAFLRALDIKPSKSLKSLLSDLNLHTLRDFFRAESQRKARQKKSRIDKIVRAYYAKLKLWEGGLVEPVSDAHIPLHIPRMNYLRANEVGDAIETSLGVRIPVNDAYRVWQLVMHTLATGRPDCRIPIKRYEITQIFPDRLIAACHTIPMDQVQKIATHFGWTGNELADDHNK